jgi:hypothetical protein
MGHSGLRRRTLELQVVYHRLSEAEHWLNFTRSKLELDKEEVDMRTHAIMHLVNAIKI